MTRSLLLATLPALILLSVGCTESHVVHDNSVAAQYARYAPQGFVTQNSQAVQATDAAVNTPNVTNVLNAVNSANGVNAAPPSNVNNDLTFGNIHNAIRAAQAANAKKMAQQQQRNTIGPGPFNVQLFGPSEQPVMGPGPLTTQFVPYSN